MSEKVYVGRKVMTFESAPSFLPFSKVKLWDENDQCFVAGDDTGRTLEADCAWATQAIAEDMLTQIRGFVYNPFSAGGAILDPSAELGDGVTVNGVYAPLAMLSINFNRDCTAEIEAPADEEIDHEIPYTTSSQKEFNRKISKTYSVISKTAEEIRLEVQGVDDKYTALSVTLDGVAVTTTNADGTKTVTLKDGIVTSDAIATGAITADKIAANAITIGKLPSDVVTAGDNISRLNNNSGYTTAMGVVNIINGTVTADYIYALGIEATSIRGAEIAIKGDDGKTYGTLYAGTDTAGSTALELTGTYGLRLMSSFNVFISAGGAAELTMQSNGNVTVGGVWDFSGATVKGI